jgi:hypothetical protein
MKLTKSKLKQIIKEELENLPKELKEELTDPSLFGVHLEVWAQREFGFTPPKLLRALEGVMPQYAKNAASYAERNPDKDSTKDTLERPDGGFSVLRDPGIYGVS